MEILLQSAFGKRADCALLFCFTQQRLEKTAPDFLSGLAWPSSAPGLADVRGKAGEELLLHGPQTAPVPRLLVCGLGPARDFTLEAFRKAVAGAAKACRGLGLKKLILPVEGLQPLAKGKVVLETLIKEAALSALLALYRCDTYRSAKDKDAEDAAAPESLLFLLPDKKSLRAAASAAREGEAEARGMIYARDLVNGPANIVTPEYLAREAGSLAERHGFACRVLGPEEIQTLGMGALWAVGRGATHGPRLIVLEHKPKGKAEDPVVFVGKGITFDTGGISLKPAAKMHEMKGDMAGAAAVLGFFEALGRMPDKDSLPAVAGIVSSAENMPDGNATRPGDVVTTMSGKTVEILNTDAEGRLALCDGLTFAQKEWKPKALFDVATLTGACVVALGDFGAGLFTDDLKLRRLVMDAAETTGDLFWPLPMWDAYDENLKSDVADFANIGPREGGALHAALFLRRFVEKGVRWAHLDIAGPGYVAKKTPLPPLGGGTGCGVRMLCELLRQVE